MIKSLHSSIASALVTVVMPCKDAARFIGPAITSVLAQTHRKLQLIVVDDGSTDQTVSLIEPFTKADSRVTLIQLDANSGGPAKPRNVGLKHVKGSYVAFIDADDIWLPQKLAYQLAAMHEHGLNFCSTLHRHFSDDSAIDSISQTALCDQPGVSDVSIRRVDHDTILRKNRIVTSSVLLHMGLLEHVHFSEETRFIAIEDYVAWLELHQLPKISSGIIQQPLVLYRARNDSISSSKLEMAGKIYTLLSVYTVQGKPLGLWRFYYYATYLLGGIKSLVLSRLNRIRS